MTKPLGLRRLHRIREAEEEQIKSGLASAIQEVHRLENAVKLVHARARRGRGWLNGSADSGDATDRIAGGEEIAAADRMAEILTGRLHSAEANMERIQKEFLAKRVERRQAATLLELATAQNVVQEKRKSQIALDDWHRSVRAADNRKRSESVRRAVAARLHDPEVPDPERVLFDPTDSEPPI